MNTFHRVQICDSRRMNKILDESVDLVITSPPYPMIQMWDNLFNSLCPSIGKAIDSGNGDLAFELMHKELDKVWRELFRIIKPGSFVCINIGDATRTINNNFQLYSNHSRIISSFKKIGFDTLPNILWHKQTNAPNKFMGSGMLPAGAYVTLEHEYILIFRKNGKRIFKTDEEKEKRMEGSFFWEERNVWFSDLWDFKGVTQNLKKANLRNRSAAFPFELAYRLINMYSLVDDIVLDPFLGTGTTSFASMSCGRNSIGIEIDKSFLPYIFADTESIIKYSLNKLINRINYHKKFIAYCKKNKKELKYKNKNHNFEVVTKQETKIKLKYIKEIIKENDYEILTNYAELKDLSTSVGITKIIKDLKKR